MREQVAKDVPRTFVSHPLLSHTGSDCDAKVPADSLLASLERILLAQLARKQARVYWQGMAFVAAFVLLVFPNNEEQAFSVFLVLLDWVLGPTFNETNPLFFTSIMDTMIKVQLPLVWKKFESLGVPPCIFTTSWLVCIFCSDIPSTSVLRIWDLLLIAVGMRVLLDTDTPTAELQTATSRMGIDLVALVSLSLLRVNSALILRANEAQTLHDELKAQLAMQYDPTRFITVCRTELFTVASESGYDLEFGATNPWSDGFPWTAFMDTVRDAAHPDHSAKMLAPGSRIKVVGLKLSKQVNGLFGVVRGQSETGKYEVQLESKKTALLSPMNVEAVIEPAPDPSDQLLTIGVPFEQLSPEDERLWATKFHETELYRQTFRSFYELKAETLRLQRQLELERAARM